MVVTTSAAALPVVLMGKGSKGSWADTMIVAPMILFAIAVVASVLTASSVRTTAGPNGFTIRWGLVGWPRCTYRIDEIDHAEVIDLPWWRVSYGFWWTPKRTNCTVRSGPTVRLSLRNQRVVNITVPEPTAAVASVREALASWKSSPGVV